jgi:HSP20 family protein
MNTISSNARDRLLTQLATIPASQTPIDGADWFPPVDIVEDDDEYLFRIDLPGVTPDNLRVAIEEADMVVCGQRADPWDGARRRLRVERPHGYFMRRFALPADAETGGINTLLAESILEIRVRKVGSRLRPPTPTNAPIKLKLRPAACTNLIKTSNLAHETGRAVTLSSTAAAR